MQADLSQGIDIVSIGRIEKALDRSGSRFLHRIFDGRELELKGYTGFLATRFAAKEAFFKALGTGVSPGLQIRCWVLKPSWVGLIPTRSRQLNNPLLNIVSTLQVEGENSIAAH